MSRIQVTPERLFEAAREVEETREQMEDTREELVRLIRWMESMWSGMVRERFLERFEENQPRMIETLEHLAHIAKELREIGVRFQQADEVSGAAVAGNVATKSIGLKVTSTTKGLEDKNQVGLQGYDASCVPPPPDACRTPVADTRNVFQKSLDSLLELGTAFMQSADDRYQKRYDSVGGFLDYWTFGIPSGLVEEYVDRANKAFDSPNDTANWLTFGIHGTIRESIFPANAWSSEHWANMMGLGGMMVGGGITAKMIKPHNLLTSSGGGIKLDASSRPPGSGQMAGEAKLPNRKIINLNEKTQNVRGDINKEIEKLRNSDEYKNLSKTQRDKFDRKLRKLSNGNVAVADVSIPGIKKEFQAHSQIHSAESVGSNIKNFSYSKFDRSLKSYVEDEFPRFNDTEAKILEDIVSQIKDPNVKGKIDLFTELDACQSCSNLIMEFRRKFPNIELNVYSNSMK
nr:WXG100 family type VII secretion target [Paenibacillus xylanexedens]